LESNPLQGGTRLTQSRTYKTGEIVPFDGEFETVTGRKMKYKDGELFQACPNTGNNVDWEKCDAER
jgi:hypothetical protein